MLELVVFLGSPSGIFMEVSLEGSKQKMIPGTCNMKYMGKEC